MKTFTRAPNLIFIVVMQKTKKKWRKKKLRKKNGKNKIKKNKDKNKGLK